MRCFLVHFRFRHCHNLEFQFVVSFLFAGGDKPTFKTTAGWCVAHRKGFAWKECRELTPRERNIDFADGVAMATAKKITKLLEDLEEAKEHVVMKVPKFGKFGEGRKQRERRALWRDVATQNELPEKEEEVRRLKNADDDEEPMESQHADHNRIRVQSRHCVNQQVAMLHGVNTLLVRNNVNCCITAGKLRDERNELG